MSKEFLIIGSKNAITYKEVFPYIQNNEMWLGCTPVKEFSQPDGTEKKFGNIGWFTNIPHAPAGKPLVLEKHYSPEEYPKYDNYDAIEVSRVADIPVDYDGIMGVPVTFLDKYCPQFEIVGRPENLDIYGLKTRVYTSQECRDAYFRNFGKDGVYDLNASSVLSDGDKLVKTYNRILIRRKDRLEPADFEIVGAAQGSEDVAGDYYLGVIPTIKYDGGKARPYLNGKSVYNRLLIKRKDAKL